MRGVLDLAVQPQAVTPLGAVRAEVAGEGSLARVHAHVLHQLVGRPGQVTAQVTAVLVALAVALEVRQELLLPGEQPLADATAMLIGGGGGAGGGGGGGGARGGACRWLSCLGHWDGGNGRGGASDGEKRRGLMSNVICQMSHSV